MQIQTWYGVKATVIIGPGFIHKTGLGGILIPHPPVINWLLRRGLAEKARFTLSFTHEYGHLQSVPLALLYALALLAVTFTTGSLSLLMIFAVLISTQAAWEIMSEFIPL